MDNRRRYFRISDSIIVNFYPITEEQKHCRIRELKTGLLGEAETRRSLLGLNTQLKSLFIHLKDKDPDIAYALELLNAKIDQVKKYVDVPDEGDESSLEQTPIDVNISACGISFSVDKPYEVGGDIALELVLCPSYQYIPIYGTIVKCEKIEAKNDHGAYQLAIDYDYIKEDDQESLISHIMKKQTDTLKAQRKARHSKGSA